MTDAWRHVLATDGTSQDDRLPAALADGYFRVDERDLADLLAWALDFAAAVPLPNRDNQPVAKWDRLLLGDDAVVIALILAAPRTLHARRFEAVLARDPAGAIETVLALARTMDGWHSRLRLGKTEAARSLADRIEALVTERLGPALADLFDLASAAGLDAVVAADLPSLGRRWRDGTRRQRDTPPRRRIAQAYQAFDNAIGELREAARPAFAVALGARNHEPATALLIAFAQLFQEVQARINGFTSRHNAFYYRRVLGASPRQPEPERALLTLPDVTNTEPVPVRRGSELVATARGSTTRLSFRADAETVASAARLVGLHTIFFERDRLISPQRELDFVTRIRHSDLGTARGDPRAPESWALLGAGDTAQDGGAATLGLAVTSPCLLLREGERRVTLDLVLQPPAPIRATIDAGLSGPELRAAFAARLQADPGLAQAAVQTTVASLLDELERVWPLALEPEDVALLPEDPPTASLVRRLMRIAGPTRPRSFTAALGRLVAHLWLQPERGLPPAVVDAIVADADRALGPRPRDEAADSHPVRRLLTESRAYQYDKYLRDAFVVELTTRDGWHRVEPFAVFPLDRGEQRPGLRIAFVLDRNAPAIEPCEAVSATFGRPATAPTVRILLAPNATFCAYGLVEPFVLEEVGIGVAVEGLRRIKAYNDLGPVDPTMPFQPFGPAPEIGANFIVGAFEPALKHIERLRLRLEWSQLPSNFGGFAGYYEAYGNAWSRQAFAVAPSWLLAGRWQPCAPRTLPLFAEVSAAERLPAATSLAFDIPAASQPLRPDTPEERFGLRLAPSAGFARLTLQGPAEAFGHRVHPVLLAQTLARSFRRKQPPPPLSPPYTPKLDRLELDYAARSVIVVGSVPAEVAATRGEYVDHIHPLGTTPVHPEPLTAEPGLLPERISDGALFVGVGRLHPGTPVSLLFRMADRARRRRGFDPPAVRWSYLTARGWREFDTDLILADTTSGLMRTGVVTLDVPADATTAGLGAPSGAVWLRVGADAELAAFPRLAALVVNGFTATRTDIEGPSAPARLDWGLATPAAGLETIVQIGPIIGGRAGEPRDLFRARIGERLRHRGRCETAWDYERAVLEMFNDVWKVKCFPALNERHTAAPTPGRVVVIVVPRAATPPDAVPFERRMFDVLTLRRIRTALTALAPAGARVDVQNAAYDFLQVRCRVRLTDEADRGHLVERLRRSIGEYLSPWSATGPAFGFGWQISADDVQAFVAEHDGVAWVGDFAMLMLAMADDGTYRLVDTARPQHAGAPATLRHSVSWSLPLPLQRQVLATQGPAGAGRATPAGVGDLVVGGTLVVTEAGE